MKSKINLMNIAIDFLPTNGGTNIKSINNEDSNLGIRSKEEDEFIVVEYIYNDKEYTMILRQKNDEWEISELYNYINLDDLEYSDDENNIDNEQQIDREDDISEGVSSNIDGKFIVDYTAGDITGDKKKDKIYLVSINKPDSTGFADDIELVIIDGKTNTTKVVALPANSGYKAIVSLYDFDGDGVKEIYISMFSEGSGGYSFYYIYSYKNSVLKVLFDFEKYNARNKYEAKYLDGYKVVVVSKNTSMKYTVDISEREKEYLNIIYNKNGKLKQATNATVTGISAMYPVDINNDHIYELDCFDRIIGINNNDTLGYIETYLAWDKDKFEPIAQNLALFGMKI